jgi:hypothetical protein
MDIPRHLRDVYRFPGFVPAASVRGDSEDAGAIVIPLCRRRKKRCAAIVGNRIADFTTNDYGTFAICPVATGGCFSLSKFAEWIVGIAAR